MRAIAFAAAVLVSIRVSAEQPRPTPEQTLAAMRVAPGFAVSLAAAAPAAAPPGKEEPKPAKPLRVCLVSGSLEYESDASLTAFQKLLEDTYGVKCSRAFRRKDDDLPGLEALDDCDVMILFTRRLTIDGEQLERVKKYVAAGKPIVGVRTASHAFQKWPALDKEVLGGNYKGHFGKNVAAEVKIVGAAKDHPVLRGVKPFASAGSLYKNTGLADDVTVLLTGTIPGHTEPVAWTRQKAGRVFYTSLGHQKDFSDENFLRLLINGVFWAAGREVPPTPAK